MNRPREQGHDVEEVAATAPGSTDTDLIERIRRENRIRRRNLPRE